MASSSHTSGLCFTLALALLAGSAGAAQDAAGPALPRPPQRTFEDQPAYRVIRVIDGDALIIQMGDKQKQIGLVGCGLPQARPAADAAKRFLANLLEGESIYLEYEAEWHDTEQVGRDWAYVYRAPDGLFVNFEIVRQGYTRVRADQPFAAVALFRAYEQRARELRKGMWGAAPTAGDDRSPGRTVVTAKGEEPAPKAASGKEAETGKPRPPAAENGGGAKPGEKGGESGAASAADESTMVFITRTGKCYHRSDCEHVKKSGRQITLKEAKEKGLSPCQTCDPPG